VVYAIVQGFQSLKNPFVTPTYNLSIRVRDQGWPSLTDMCIISVTVIDAHDNAPHYTRSLYSVDIVETTSPGTVITQVTAIDGENGINSQVTYSIVSMALGTALFDIDPQSGVLTLVGHLDYESAR